MPLRPRTIRTCAALLSIGSLVACARNAPQRSAGDSREIASSPPGVTAPRGERGSPGVTVPRSQRGNPPFYDVFGKRYHVLDTGAGYAARGIASWYGRDFHGLATSSGETYNMHAMTAAHTTLPLPTWVEVTNLANGKRVVVKVNDRGPFVDNRIIDLSYAAATELDMVRSGTTRVEVRAVAPPLQALRRDATVAAAPDAFPPPLPPVAGAPAVATQRLYVQIGAFAQHENAARLVARLRSSGFTNPAVVSEPDGRRTMHRVRLGPIRDSTEFDEVNARLRAVGVSGSQLVVDRGP
jgi:rare lipoprotein A